MKGRLLGLPGLNPEGSWLSAPSGGNSVPSAEAPSRSHDDLSSRGGWTGMGAAGGLVEEQGREARLCCLDAALVRVATGWMVSCAEGAPGQ